MRGIVAEQDGRAAPDGGDTVGFAVFAKPHDVLGLAAGSIAPGHPGGQRDYHILGPERVAGMVHPVVHLELDP